MTAPDRSAVDSARSAQDQSQRTFAALLGAAAPDPAKVAAARAAVATARDALTVALGQWLRAQPEDEVGRLEAGFPVLLLPVRLETRFAMNPASKRPELRVRIYPDTIAADTHEEGLSPEEVAAGTLFWQSAWNPADEADAWRVLVGKFTAARAAYIALAMTPTNTATRPSGAPVFPRSHPSRAASWTRAATSSVMPDRWIVLAFQRDAATRRAIGAPIPDPLPLTMTPERGTPRSDVSGDGLELDDDVRWTVDFERAVQAGMAVRFDVSSRDLSVGFDRLVALGIKGSLAPAASADRLKRLFDGHHYTRGLAFAAQGTPTSGTSDTRPVYPPSDPGGSHSFRVERRPPTGPGADGALAARALGIDPGTFASVEGSNGSEQALAAAMNDALWPTTWGYFLNEMMAPVFGPSATQLARDHFVGYVRGRGPLPALRVGSTPYGVLPVTSLARWQPRNAGDVDAQLAPALRTLLPSWSEQVANVPRVTAASSDPDGDLLRIFTSEARAQTVRVRGVLGSDFHVSLFDHMGFDPNVYLAHQEATARAVLARIGHPEWNPKIVWSMFDAAGYLYAAPLVAAPPSSESSPLPYDYVSWIASASYSELDGQVLPPATPVPDALLYRLLRHAALVEYTNVAAKILVDKGVVAANDARERELVGLEARPKLTVAQLARQPLAAVSGSQKLGDYVVTSAGTDVREAQRYRGSLKSLVGVPTAELERLLTETLDVCSHRIDAWVTSIATRRLMEMRATDAPQAGPPPPPTPGLFLGGFGWIEDLRPEDPTSFHLLPPAEVGAATEVRVPSFSGGYIHAPSMAQAATAAILRNAYLTHRDASDARYAIDLSSAKIRAGRDVLDAVRQGQPLGAVLGYRLERALHDAVPTLAKYVQPLRMLFPIASPPDGTGGSWTETVAPRNVVDGLAARAAWKAGSMPFGSRGLPVPESGDHAALVAALGRLDDAVDAVSDLLTAESVHQLVRGSTAGASASLDAMARGIRPPDPAVVRTPRGGLSLTHRVAVVLGGDSPMATARGWGAKTPRAVANPYVDAWIGQLLGDPSTVRCQVAYVDAHGATVQKVVTLDQLNLCPIDVLALATTLSATQSDSELDRRVLDAALSGVSGATSIRVQYERAPGWDPATVRTIPEVLEVARVVSDLLGKSRALRPEDLLPRESGVTVTDSSLLPDLAESLLADAIGGLQAARDGIVAALASPVDPSTLRKACRTAAAYGVVGAFVSFDAQQPELRNQAGLVKGEIERRLALAQAARAKPDATASARVTAAGAVLQAVFGAGFPFLPSFKPANAVGTLDASLAAGPALLDDPNDPAKWFQKVARVRPALGMLRRVLSYAQAFGATSPAIGVAQLPYAPGDRWMALPFATAQPNLPAPAPPRSGCLSLDLVRASAPSQASAWVGLLIDEWSETIPRANEVTGIGVHYGSPRPQAPQLALLAVPPSATLNWDFAALVDSVASTLDLAKVRVVDPSLLGSLAQLLPAAYVALNPAGETISTDLSAHLAVAPAIDTSGA